MTVKGSFAWAIPKSLWDFGVTGFGTLVPVTESGSVRNLALNTSEEVQGVRFFGVNLRTGRAIYRTRRFRVGLQGGLYWTTMLVSSANLGFQNLMGPQIFPTLAYGLSSESSVRGYVKLAAIGKKASIQGLSSNELALGGAYDFKWKGLKQSVNLDLARLNFAINSTEIQSATASLGWGLFF
jgi:hypothetical protein